MNEDVPKVDMFGMSIDYGESYYITHDEKVVHSLNVVVYFSYVSDICYLTLTLLNQQSGQEI